MVAGQAKSVSDFEVGKPRIVRRSPLAPTVKHCPRCLKPLQRGSKLGGWLIPQDYYCASCGYRGTLYLEEEPKPKEPQGEETK